MGFRFSGNNGNIRCKALMIQGIGPGEGFMTSVYSLIQNTGGVFLLLYCKNPKYSDTQKFCCNYPKIWTSWLYQGVMHPKDAAGIANSVDSDQTALVWSLRYAQNQLSTRLVGSTGQSLYNATHYNMVYGFGYNTVTSWLPNGYFPIVNMQNCPFIIRLSYNTIRFYGSQT